ncbi:MAG TPA: hypothetical protein DEP87_02625 [Candidatus Pacebacteria bacterium]|nr:hypothetical protein [Candidatus Paceibacterota bacterium]
MTILVKIYRWLWLIKHQILVSGFGFSSYCKHSPTCSEFWLLEVKSHGTIAGSWRGFLRLLSCW